MDVVNIFLKIVTINSPSGQEHEIGEFIMQFLQDRGINATIDSVGNIFYANPNAEILLTAHMDTVQGDKSVNPIINNDVITSSGDSILGADDKANLAAILAVVDDYYQNKREYNFELLFTVQEELGMKGIKQFDLTKISAKHGLSFDKSEFKFGTIVTQAPFGNSVKVSFYGKEAHSSNPDEGINALMMMTDFIKLVPPGGDSKSATLNYGLMEGGRSGNTVPGNVFIKGDFRSADKQNSDKIIDDLYKAKEIVEKNYKGGKIELEINEVVRGYKIVGSNFLEKVKAVIKDLTGNDPEGIVTTSGSDAAVLNAHGVETLVVASGSQSCHSNDEKISVADLQNIPKVILNLIK